MHSEKGFCTKKGNIINKCQCLKFILQSALHSVQKVWLEVIQLKSTQIKWKMNKVQPCDSSSTDQSESSSTVIDELEDDILSAVAPPIPKDQGLFEGRINF